MEKDRDRKDDPAFHHSLPPALDIITVLSRAQAETVANESRAALTRWDSGATPITIYVHTCK